MASKPKTMFSLSASELIAKLIPLTYACLYIKCNFFIKWICRVSEASVKCVSQELGLQGDNYSIDLCVLNHVWLCDPMDWSHQSPLPMGFPRWEYQSEFSKGRFSRGIFLTQESNLCLVSPALAGGSFTTMPPGILMNIEVAQLYPILKIKTNKWNVLISLQTIPNLIVYFPTPLNSKTSGKDWWQEERGWHTMRWLRWHCWFSGHEFA